MSRIDYVLSCLVMACAGVTVAVWAQAPVHDPVADCTPGDAPCWISKWDPPESVKVCNDAAREQRVRIIDCQTGKPQYSMFLRPGECAECPSAQMCCLAAELRIHGSNLYPCRDWLGIEDYGRTCRIDEETVSIRLKVVDPEPK